jgi:hypothetical protein
LELWRASSLAQETRTCEAMYDKINSTGNATQLATLRRSIEARIDDLETFFIENLDDERAVLFEKQVCPARWRRDRTPAGRALSCGSAALRRASLLSCICPCARDARAVIAAVTTRLLARFTARVGGGSALHVAAAVALATPAGPSCSCRSCNGCDCVCHS